MSLRAALAAAAVALTLVPGQVAARERGPGAVAGPVRLVIDEDFPAAFGGHRYIGSLVLVPAFDGLVVVNELTLERYLLGLNEVPLDWPEEALKAQAVAARTYALFTLARPRAGSAALYGFDICATVACQVFSGADVLLTPDGERWRRAVAETRAEAVTYRGEPILARYHSTSGGVTFDNEQIFTTEPSYPYLVGVPSPWEQASPLYRWTVRFPVARLQRLLEEGGWWPDRFGRLVEVYSAASSQGLHYLDVVFRGRRGALVRTAEELRDLLRELAPALSPGRYPSRARTSSGRLPETLPSNRYEVSTRAGVAVFRGRGWGHGVGMSQYGAHGLALRGASYRAILSHYYRGTRVEKVASPGRIDVGLAWGRSSATVSGAFRIEDGRGRTLVRDALGTWRFSARGSAVVVDPPRGHGLPLEVGLVEAPATVAPGERVRLELALTRPARVRALAQGAPGEVVVRRAGTSTLAWRAPERPGTYEVRVEARAGAARRLSAPVAIVVANPASPRSRSDPAQVAAEPGLGLVAAASATVLAAAGTMLLWGRRSRSRIRSKRSSS